MQFHNLKSSPAVVPLIWDLVVECTETDSAKLEGTIFAHFRRPNAVEFKGYRDPLTAVDLNRIRMRAWGLGTIDDPSRSIGSTRAL